MLGTERFLPVGPRKHLPELVIVISVVIEEHADRPIEVPAGAGKRFQEQHPRLDFLPLIKPGTNLASRSYIATSAWKKSFRALASCAKYGSLFAGALGTTHVPRTIDRGSFKCSAGTPPNFHPYSTLVEPPPLWLRWTGDAFRRPPVWFPRRVTAGRSGGTLAPCARPRSVPQRPAGSRHG